MTNYEDMNPGVFWATLRKAVDQLGGWPDVKDWTVGALLDGFPLTAEEREQAIGRHELATETIRAMRASRGAD